MGFDHNIGSIVPSIFSWLRSSRSNVTVSKRNVMVLILALSMMAYVVNGATGLANFLLMLQEQLRL